MDSILSFLDTHNVSYMLQEHPAVFTCEDSRGVEFTLPGENTKNLFIRDKKGRQYFLVVVGHEKRVDLKALAKELGVQGVSFGSQEKLMEYLGVEPGSVSILGLVHDTENAVKVYIDTPLWEAEQIQCHPLRNTATLALTHEGLEVFLQAVHHDVQVIDVPQKEVS